MRGTSPTRQTTGYNDSIIVESDLVTPPMPLFGRWFKSSRPKFHPDAYTLTCAGKLRTLREWVGDLLENGRAVLIICHFQSSFLEIQAALDEAGLEYEVLANRVHEDQLVALVRRHDSTRVMLTMAPMLEPSALPRSDPRRPIPSLAMIITERHPLPAPDRCLEQFARNLNTDVALGYLLSFDDPVVRHYLGPRFIELMQQLGMGSNDLISSAMTRRALDRAIRRNAISVTDELPADSPSHWLERNLTATGTSDNPPAVDS